MKNNEENYDEGQSSDGEESKPGFETLLSNPSYLSSTMKVVKCVFRSIKIILMLKLFSSISACFAQGNGQESSRSRSEACQSLEKSPTGLLEARV